MQTLAASSSASHSKVFLYCLQQSTNLWGSKWWCIHGYVLFTHLGRVSCSFQHIPKDMPKAFSKMMKTYYFLSKHPKFKVELISLQTRFLKKLQHLLHQCGTRLTTLLRLPKSIRKQWITIMITAWLWHHLQSEKDSSKICTRQLQPHRNYIQWR